MKGKVLADIVRQEETKAKQEKRRKRHQKKVFARRFDKLKEVNFTDWDNLNMDEFRAIPKSIFSYNLTRAALAVYPPLCAEADFEEDKTFQISQKEIADWAGISENTAIKGIKELEGVGLLSREKVMQRGSPLYIYKVNFIRKPKLKEHRGDTIYFYPCIVRNGIWANISLAAKTLYLKLRAEAKQDLETYSSIEGENYDELFQGINYDDYIRNRKWDVCMLSLAEMAQMAGTGRNKINTVLDELEKYKLIERIEKWTKVYLKPKKFLKKPCN